MADKKPHRTFVVVSHTHWDREWYLPFEQFRARLVDAIDRLIDLLDRDPDYRHFVLDGQTIALDDYLEIRPDRRADIERHVRSGRLLIGPNYVLPDEFLIGGESWVRNLQIGIRSARAFGPVMMVGYSPDAFGHIAHLPAVLRGFGIDSVVLWRGVGREATKSEFLWRAPDGSEVLVLHLPFGYAIAAALPEEPEALRNQLSGLRAMLEPLATTPCVLLPNGNDHAAPQENLSQVLRSANQMFQDTEFVHGHYPMVIDAIREELKEDGLPCLEGEFRSSQRSHVLAGVLSARIWIKQRYQECEDLLARRAEPLAVWAHLLRTRNGSPAEKGRSDHALLHQAWKLLLQNAPHDSICGCSVDQVHDEMRTRFDRCHQIGQAVLFESQRYIARLASPPDEPSVVVFNSEDGPRPDGRPSRRTDFCTVRLPRFAAGQLPARLISDQGEAVPLQVLRRGLRSPRDALERVEAGFVAQVPAFGYRALRLEYGEPQPETGTSQLEIENERFRVAADTSDGALIVEDKRSPAMLRGLNRFQDGGDRGDEYTYCPPARDELIGRPAMPPQVRVAEGGPARRTIEVRLTYALPAGLTEDRDDRSSERVECQIVSRVSLYPGVPRIDIETEVENRAQDHRLRVHFPSGIRAGYSWSEQHFGVVSRPVALPEDDGAWMETPVGTHPQKSFVDVNDGQRGLMLANRGLPEYEVMREADGTATIALTLLRCVGWLSRDDLRTRRGPAGPSLETPAAQMLGRWAFHYSLIPHSGGWEEAFAEAHRFARPLAAVRYHGGTGALPPEGSLVEVEPAALVVSSLKLAEDGGLVARVYNISARPVEGRLRLTQPHGAVQVVNLNEETLGQAKIRQGWVRLAMAPNEIATLKFRAQ